MKLIRNKRVGKVLLIVEGARYEFHLAKKIFVDESYKMQARLGREVKAYINRHAKTISMNKMNEKSVVHAGVEMYRFLKEQDIIIDLDDFSDTNEAVFAKEERNLQEKDAVRLLSLFSCMLLDLGILRN